jgi:hypothetical protein
MERIDSTGCALPCQHFLRNRRDAMATAEHREPVDLESNIQMPTPGS